MSAPEDVVNGPMRFRVKFYDGERCWGVEHNQSAEQVAALIATWGLIPPKPTERVVVEQGDER